MAPEEILKYPARVLTEAQREKYFMDGFVSVEIDLNSETTSSNFTVASMW